MTTLLCGPFKQWYYSWLHRKADEAISISQFMFAGIESSMALNQHGVNHRVIANPHNIDQIIERSKETPDLFEFEPDKLYLVSAGRLVKHKKVDVIVKAIGAIKAQVPNVELLILGDGAERASLEELAQQEGVSAFTHFLGHCSNPFPYISKSTLFIMASEPGGPPKYHY